MCTFFCQEKKSENSFIAADIFESMKNKRNWASKVPAQNRFLLMYCFPFTIRVHLLQEWQHQLLSVH